MNIKNILPQTLLARDACLQNAEDLLVASKAVLNEKIFNIGYQLAVVALEEIGKACLLTVSKIQRSQWGQASKLLRFKPELAILEA